MDCKQSQLLMIDFIDKNLDQKSTDKVKKHLSSCKSCQQEFDQTLMLLDDLNLIQDNIPPDSIKQKFLQNLEIEKAKLDDRPVRELNPTASKIWIYNPFSMIAAGFALLVSGLFLGYMLNNQPDSNLEVGYLQQEVVEMKQMLFMAKLEQSSASQRIQAVNFANDFKEPDNEILDALISTMNTDDNINVRMAAIHALSKFTSEEKVRDALVQSLKTQQDALLQITLINTLVEIQEPKAIDVMKDLLQEKETIEAVKQMAEKGLTTFI